MKRHIFTLAMIAVMALPSSIYAQSRNHTVKRGETIETIAKKYRTSSDELLKLNPDAAKFFYTGMKLMIPDNSLKVETISETRPEAAQSADAGTPAAIYNPSDLQVQAETIHNQEKAPESNHITDLIGFSELNWDVCISGEGGKFKDRSAYGLTFGLYKKVYQRLLLGGEISFSMNYGLVDFDYASMITRIHLGPALAINQSGSFFVSCPLGASIGIADKIDKETGKKKGTKAVGYFSFTPKLHYILNKAHLSLGFPITTSHGTTSANIQIGLGLYY